jgi:hypothetical protein
VIRSIMMVLLCHSPATNVGPVRSREEAVGIAQAEPKCAQANGNPADAPTRVVRCRLDRTGPRAVHRPPAAQPYTPTQDQRHPRPPRTDDVTSCDTCANTQPITICCASAVTVTPEDAEPIPKADEQRSQDRVVRMSMLGLPSAVLTTLVLPRRRGRCAVAGRPVDDVRGHRIGNREPRQVAHGGQSVIRA